MSRGIRRTLWRFFGNAMCVWCVWRGNFVTKRATASRALGLRCVALEHRGDTAATRACGCEQKSGTALRLLLRCVAMRSVDLMRLIRRA